MCGRLPVASTSFACAVGSCASLGTAVAVTGVGSGVAVAVGLGGVMAVGDGVDVAVEVGLGTAVGGWTTMDVGGAAGMPAPAQELAADRCLLRS